MFPPVPNPDTAPQEPRFGEKDLIRRSASSVTPPAQRQTEVAKLIDVTKCIGCKACQAACAECAKWPGQIMVSINLSAKDFRSRDVVRKVRDTLASSGLHPSRLEIEVTETALLDDRSQTLELVEEIRGLGVGIALDDFGTGYSSLSYLHKLPLDKVKIDRSFLRDVPHNARSLDLLRGIVDLTRTLGLTVTVEGVETFEQLKVLSQQLRPDLVQGFLFGSALSASGIETMSSTVWPFVDDIEKARTATAG